MVEESATHNSESHQHVTPSTNTSGKKNFKDKLTVSNIGFTLAILVILAATISIRLPLAGYQGFYEPDGFYHYAVIRAAVSNDFIVPKVLGLSGYPAATVVAEPQGLYWITLIPYAFLQFFGVSYYTIMRFIPLVFALAGVLLSGVLARFLSKDRLFVLLSMAFVALSSGDAARTSALIYRGDSFVTIFLLAALVCMGLLLEQKTEKRKIIFAILGGFALSICNLVWNGSSFAVVVYVLAFVLITIYAFVMDKRDLLGDMKYVFASIVLWFALASSYLAIGWMLPQTLVSIDFILFLVLMGIGWYAAHYLSENKHMLAFFTQNHGMRLALVAVFCIIAAIAVSVLASNLLYQIFVGNGFVTNTSFASTIQELTPPNPGFLFASFNVALYASPVALIMFLSTYTSLPVTFAWLIVLLGFIPYLLMRIYDSKGWMGGRARIAFDVKPELFALISFFAVTAYLQMSAIRFNSLVAIPIAIFGAYTIYWVISYISGKITSAKLRKGVTLLSCGLIILLMLTIFSYDMYFGSNIRQADSIDPGFLAAASWIKNNTAPGSVFLTVWPDGSVIEGWGNRTSVTDSVGSQNLTKANAFANWLFNGTADPQFLSSSINGKPDYLLVRYSWLSESAGIFTEAGINTSLQDQYGYAPLSGIREKLNTTERAFQFIGDNNLTADLYITPNGIISYLEVQNGESPFSNVVFYNMSDGLYNAFNQSTYYNHTNGQTLAVAFSPISNPYLPLNITGAYLFAPGIAQSNMVKFLFECNTYQCAWNNNKTTLSMVFINNDTKIFKISYNNATS